MNCQCTMDEERTHVTSLCGAHSEYERQVLARCAPVHAAPRVLSVVQEKPGGYTESLQIVNVHATPVGLVVVVR